VLVFDNIRDLARQIMRYAGNGYTKIQVTKIPKHKTKKIPNIENKLKKRYKLDLTTNQRQYRRRKGKANFVGLRYKETVIIMRTAGETEITEKFRELFGTEIPFEYLKLVLIKDEREKMTFRMERKFVLDIKAKISQAIKERNGRKFHHEIKKLYSLSKALPYRGIGLQIAGILKSIERQQREHGTHWSVPRFFR